MTDFYPHRRILTIWRMVAAGLALVAAFVTALFLGQNRFLFRLLTGLWVVVFLGYFVIYCPVKYNQLKYSVGNGQVLQRGGVLYRRVKAIPLANIQFTVAFATPLHRLFGLCTVALAAAGGTLFLTGLTRADAQRLRELIASPAGPRE